MVDNDVQLRGMRVLVVDDTPAILCGLVKILEALHGAQVSTAADEQQALRILERTEVDAAILDLILENGSSLEVARSLRRRGTPFVFLSGYGRADLLPDEFRSELMLNKPCDPGRLVRALQKLVRSEGRL